MNIPAFPTTQYANGVTPTGHAEGMTLRDYFAAKAMQGIQSRVNWSVEAIADLAYKQADEMLKAREQ